MAATAAATGETWIPTTGSSVSGVSFLGRGTLGDFKGLYWETATILPPVFGDCSAAATSHATATLSITLADLGAGSGSATVAVSLAGGSGAEPPSLVFTAPGSQTLSLAGLAPDTAYTLALVNGKFIANELNEDGSVVLDANHFLAGQELNFEVTLVEIL